MIPAERRHVLMALVDDPDGPTDAVAAQLRDWIRRTGLRTQAHLRAWRLEATNAPVGTTRPHHLYGMASRAATGLLEIDLSVVPSNLAKAPKGLVTVFVVDRVAHVESPQPMLLQRLGFTQRQPTLTVEEFATNWRSRHVPLVLRSGPKFASYSTSVVRLGEIPWDGVAAQEFSSKEAAKAHDINNRQTHPDVYEDAVSIVRAAEQYWSVPVVLADPIQSESRT